MEEQTSSKLGNDYVKAVYCHPPYLIYMQSTSCEMPHSLNHKLESRLPGEISTTSDMQMIPHSWQTMKKMKESLDKSERGEWKSWLKTQHSKTKITASGPITLWQIDGETMETVTDSIFLGSKITADGDCSHEIKRHLLLGRKIMTNLDSILEGNGNPLQCSCLEYPMDGGAWWAMVHGVPENRKRLKWLSKQASKWVFKM